MTQDIASTYQRIVNETAPIVERYALTNGDGDIMTDVPEFDRMAMYYLGAVATALGEKGSDLGETKGRPLRVLGGAARDMTRAVNMHFGGAPGARVTSMLAIVAEQLDRYDQIKATS